MANRRSGRSMTPSRSEINTGNRSSVGLLRQRNGMGRDNLKIINSDSSGSGSEHIRPGYTKKQPINVEFESLSSQYEKIHS